ncbi:major facilitator superfamily domain-containing protein [Podospora fimiseda]|uniref:Major facilitator superfamily domain-containing protein n=1 Tax=Podospora fimiseda TaxID=252190 RepID=A0AAN7BW54_9PEZI|nr:major facilitator superfamily domain-containing protein [Podospora fimiseda]
MLDRQLHRARVVSSVAATLISLACGTNYVYSAWAPQFADKLHLTTTQSNLIGLAGNLGMYSMGVPIGYFVDHRGPRGAVIAGAFLLGLGYLPFRTTYETEDTDQIPWSIGALCVFSYLTGLGGCMAFQASVKTSALNWPHHRGTATAFPMAAFGLSAFFFSMFGSILFPGDTSRFLGLLSGGTFTLIFGGFWFLKVYPHAGVGGYHAVSNAEAQRMRRTSGDYAEPASKSKSRSRSSLRGNVDVEPGRSTRDDDDGDVMPTRYTTPPVAAGSSDNAVAADVEAGIIRNPTDSDDADETSSLMSKASSLPGDVLVQSSVDMDRSHRVDIRGWRLLRNFDFWQLFAIMGILAGIGLMTINNIGHNVHALWRMYDDNVGETFLIQRQQMHVSILSVGSFTGRLLSGVGSDFLVKVVGASRAWCLVVASLVFCLAQVAAINITDPHFLFLVSSLSGLGYGFLFGVFPSIVAETFGIHGLSQNWGFMTLSPVLSGNIFNLFYGYVFDSHVVMGDNGERWCPDGLDCYKNAYFVTLGACGLGLVVTLMTIVRERNREDEGNKGSADD